MEFQLVSDGRRAGYTTRRMDDFAARCREGGLAVTPQRLAIIETLLGSTDHPRAEEIFAEVRRRHPHISLATVHRTLETLCRIGEARKVTALHDSARYDGNLAPHHHVICVRCRRIRDVEFPDSAVCSNEPAASRASSRSDGRWKSRRCARLAKQSGRASAAPKSAAACQNRREGRARSVGRKR